MGPKLATYSNLMVTMMRKYGLERGRRKLETTPTGFELRVFSWTDRFFVVLVLVTFQHGEHRNCLAVGLLGWI